MTSLWFESFLLPSGWAQRVRIDIESGRILSIESGAALPHGAEHHAIGLPGLPNVHSHAFQRAMAGRTEVRAANAHNFWSWRDTMYRFVDAIGPDDIEAITAFAYMEMLEAGFTRVGEFHYLHHDRGGRHFDDLAEMAGRVAAAAQSVGIGLTLLPAFYAHSGFGGALPDPRQLRFVTDIDGYASLLERSRQAVSTLDDAVVGIAPHSLRACTPAELTSLIALAGNAPVHIHLAEQAREVEDCLSWCGHRPATWLLDAFDVNHQWCLVHATHVDQHELARIVRSGAVVGLCPITEANLGDGIFPAAEFLALSGSYGVGSDSNVLIDPAAELRSLEYSQRLALRARNVMAHGDGRSTGRSLFDSALDGGSQALGAPNAGIHPLSPADLIALDSSQTDLAGRTGDPVLDAWIFAARHSPVDCVWRFGRKVVSGGRHVHREQIDARYRASMERLAAASP
jgi:formimidoylglutamate deiminase